MEFEVQKDKVLVKKDKVTTSDASGIIIPEGVRKPPSMGEVLKVGPMVTFVKPGDKVVFSRYAGMFLEVDESLEEPELVVLNEDELLAKVS